MKFPCIRFFTLLIALVSMAVAGRGDGSLSAGSMVFHGGVSGLFDPEKNPVVVAEYRFAYSRAGFRPWASAGWATDGAVFAGAGLGYTLPGTQPWRVSGGFGPGYYDRHEGKDLGSHLEFLSYVEISYAVTRKQTAYLRLSHISNGSSSDNNPGTELLTFGWGFSLR